MIKYIMILFLFAGNTWIFPQEISRQQLDQMFSDFMRLRNVHGETNTGVKNQYIKCGTIQVNSVRLNFDSFTPEQQQILKPLLARPTNMQTSLVSLSGFFRIHYDTISVDGINNVPKYYTNADTLHYSANELLKMYIDSVAIAADSAYDFEINFLGYPPPPPDNGAGGDDKYDIYIEDLVSYGEYGETNMEGGGDKGPSYIILNSDFTTFPTKGISAVRVTLAHEFHHSIQMGNYIYRPEDGWFHELTSTSMETFVYNSIKDYYYYLSNYFSNPNRSIAENNLQGGDGYDLAIWNIFQRDKFGFDIIKREWELMPTERAIVAINQSITEKGALFSQVLNEFGIRVFYTNYRTKFAPPGKTFSEGANYPLLTLPQSLIFPPYSTINGTNYPVSNNYLKIIIRPSGDLDSLAVIITNSDYNSAVANTSTLFNFQYQLSNTNFSGSRNLAGKYYVLLTVPQHQFWADSEILNNILADSSVFNNGNTDIAFPSPFRYGSSGNVNIYIPADPNPIGSANLNIYSMSMILVFSSPVIIEKPFGHPVIKWTPRNNNNERLSSGIYIYAVKSGDNIKTGKIVIFNE